jgi:ElaB/YqjD/DUF883 family membrane-anchored ribosome-binding protein
MQGDNELPEGTDTIIEGVGEPDNIGSLSTDITAPEGDEGETLTIDSGSAGTGGTGSTGGDAGSLTDRLRSGREKLTGQAGERARGFVTQGLERTAEALANVSKMVGDTAGGIEERLGAEYADYARRAAGSIENVANSIASKDPDELIDDTRSFVRNSPGIALAGAAVVGFVVARLVKTGLGSQSDSDED